MSCRNFIDNELSQILEELEKHGSDAFKSAKKAGGAIILEDGWIVKVLPDNSRVKIKWIGDNFVKIKKQSYKIK